MGFSDETFRFLDDLGKNNTRDWFEANRERYETHWRDAALDFIAGIGPEMAKQDPPLKAEPKLNGSLRRINRDVRFSKDKSPYSARLHMIFWSGGHPNRSPAVHFVLHPGGVGFGAGQFGMAATELGAVRDRIIDPKDGARLIAALDQAADVGCTMGDPDLLRLPKGYVAEGRRGELLRHKAIVARTFDGDASAGVITGNGARDWVLSTTKALMPLVRWLYGS